MANSAAADTPIYSKSSKIGVTWIKASRATRPAGRTPQQQETIDTEYHTYMEFQRDSPPPADRHPPWDTPGPRQPVRGGVPTLLSQTLPAGRARSTLEPRQQPIPQRAPTPTRTRSVVERRPVPEGGSYTGNYTRKIGARDMDGADYNTYQGKKNSVHPSKDNSAVGSGQPIDSIGSDPTYPQTDYPASTLGHSLYQTRTDPIYPQRDYPGSTLGHSLYQGRTDPLYPTKDYPGVSRNTQRDPVQNDPIYPPKDYLGATQGQNTYKDRDDQAHPSTDYARVTKKQNMNSPGNDPIYPEKDYPEYSGDRNVHQRKANPILQAEHYPRQSAEPPYAPRSGDRSGVQMTETSRVGPYIKSPYDLPWRGEVVTPTNNNMQHQRDLYTRRQARKMNGCHKFLRWATALFTFVIFLAGAGILGLGIYILGSDYGAKQMSEILGNDLYQIAAYVLITSGAIVMLMSMCGCCGALRESKCMLSIFIFTLSVLTIALIIATVFVFVFRGKMEGEIIHSMEDVLIKKYGVDMEHSENRMVTDMWNWLQRELHCCGVTGDVNSSTSWAIYKHSVWYKGFETGKPYVPQSCCKTDGHINACTGITEFNGPPSKGPPLSASMMTNPNLYTLGCYDELVHYIQNHAVIIGASSIAGVIAMCFGIFFSICLCRRIGVEDEFY